jgi:hypothetical protein
MGLNLNPQLVHDEVTSLSPDTQEILSPVVSPIMQPETSFLDQRAIELELVKKLHSIQAQVYSLNDAHEQFNNLSPESLLEHSENLRKIQQDLHYLQENLLDHDELVKTLQDNVVLLLEKLEQAERRRREYLRQGARPRVQQSVGPPTITSGILLELNKMKESLQTQLQQDTSNYISAAESRVTQEVLTRISREYSSVGIKCVQAKSQMSQRIGEINSHIASQQVALSNLTAVTTQLKSTVTALPGEIESRHQHLSREFNCLADSYRVWQNHQDDLSANLLDLRQQLSRQEDRIEDVRGLLIEHLRSSSARECNTQHFPQDDISRSPSVASNNSASTFISNNGEFRRPAVPMPGFRRALPNLDPSNPSDPPSPLNRSLSPIQRRPVPAPRHHVGAARRLFDNTSLSILGSEDHHSFDRIKRKIHHCGDLIKSITDMDFTQVTTKAQVIEIATYDAETLGSLKEELRSLEKKAEKINISDDDLWNYMEEISSSIRRWEMTLNNKKRSHHLHLSGERNLLKNIELPPFTGAPDNETVYSFLETFFRFSDATCSPRDQAVLLVSTYLSEPIKKEVESFKDDIVKIKSYLIGRYGDLRYVTESKLRSLARLRHPSSAPQSQIDYYKKVNQCLLHVEALANSDLVNKEEIAGNIFNSTYVKSMVSHLPDEIVDSFSRKVELESSQQSISGKRYFEVLKGIIDLKWRQLSTSDNIRSLRDHGNTQKSSKNAHCADIQPNSANHGNVTIATSQVLTFPCPFHGKSSNHELGKCSEFFEADNAKRREMCRKNLTCFSCMKPECLQASKNSCITTLPAGFLCVDCANIPNRRTCNVLNCTKQNHSRPTLKELSNMLHSYLKVLDRSLFGKLKNSFKTFHPSNQPVLKSTKPSNTPKSKSTFDKKATVPSFDTESGENTIPCTPISKESEDDCLYVFQLLCIKGEQALVFFDSGASGNLCRGEFAEKVGFKTIDPTNQRIYGISNLSMWTGYGTYCAQLGPDSEGVFWELTFQGISEISSRYPKYTLSSINKEVWSTGRILKSEILPPFIGGQESDLLIGFKTPDLCPQLVFSLPSGLGLYKCPFKDIHGSYYAYGGSHPVITAVNKSFSSFNVHQITAMLSQQIQAYHGTPWMLVGELPSKFTPLAVPLSKYQSSACETTALTGEDLSHASLLTESILQPHLYPSCMESVTQPSHSESEDSVQTDLSHTFSQPTCITTMKGKITLEKLRQIMDPDEPIVDFRCPDCENCERCKSSPILKSTSIREQLEQRIIEKSIRISYLEQKVIIKLPFVVDPVIFLKKHFKGNSSNYHQALTRYIQQCKGSVELKSQIRLAMDELISAGFIAPVDSADESIKEIIEKSEVLHFHLWHAVMKASISTPCRLVVDSTSTMLNLCLAKGDMGLPSMLSILLRSRASPSIWTADIRKLYNQLHLDPESVPYSLFLYHENLDPAVPPRMYYMCRGWYGIKSTGPQALATISQAGSDHVASHPKGSRSLLQDTFVDDLNSGGESFLDCQEQVGEVQEILSHIGMSLKYIAYSGLPPPEQASSDGVSMTTLGYKWFPEGDILAINLPEVNFKKKTRGIKPTNETPATSPESIQKLCSSLKAMTRQHVVGKVGECYDPLGLVEPLKAYYKRSMTRLNTLDWKDPIPDSERLFWTKNFEYWPALSNLTFPRSAVPKDAINPVQYRLICCSDSSADCGGAVVYLSCKLSSGMWSSRILTAKSKLMNMSVPRNELHSLMIGCELTFAVVVSLSLPIDDILICTDSQVSLCWVSNDRTRNKVFVHNKIITVNRYIKWIQERVGPMTGVEIVHIPGNLNPADILTKGTIHPYQLDIDSEWQRGLDWMKVEVESMPLTRFSDISLNKDQVSQFLEETVQTDLEFNPDPVYGSNILLLPSDKISQFDCILRPPFFFSGEGLHAMHSDQEDSKGKSNGYVIDVVHHGWLKSNRVLKHCIMFGLKLFHKTHMNTQKLQVKKTMSKRCTLCLIVTENDKSQSCISSYIFVSQDESSISPNSVNSSSKSRLTPIQGDIFQENTEVGSESALPGSVQAPKDSSTQLDLVQPVIDNEDILVMQLQDFAIQRIVDCYWNVIASEECKKVISRKDLIHYQTDPTTGVLYYKGRISNEQSISVHDLDMLDLKFLDQSNISFHAPCILPSSKIFYAFCMYIHNIGEPHGGVERTLLEISKRFYPIKGRKMIAKIIKDCIKCKIIRKKLLEYEMKNHHSVKLTFAPAFCFVSLDLAQDFHTKTRFQGRQTMRCPALVLVCITTGACAIYALEDWTTQSVVLALERHSCRYGVPSTVFVDSGSQVKKLSELKFNIQDLRHRLHEKMSCNVVVSAPKAHNVQGKVERKIGLIRDMMSKLGKCSFLQSFLGWESIFAHIANHLNNLPLCRASSRSVATPEYNILTPNRLLLGRNNQRSLVGPMMLDAPPSLILERAKEAQETFFRLASKQLHLLIPKPKWFKSSTIMAGDIVLFFMKENSLKASNQTWKYGSVKSISGQRLTIEYTLQGSFSKKLIERSVRDCVRIANESELDFNTQRHHERVNIS